MMNARMVLFGGMGYPVTETPWGMPQLKTRLHTLGLDVLLVNWKDRQPAYNFMHGFTGWRGYAGDSLGAGSAAQYPGDVAGEVQCVAGFQPSMYDERSHSSSGGAFERPEITVTSNVVRAHAVYDPYWIDTAGLGYATYTPTTGAKTIVLNTQHRGAHPDDWGYSQDLIFNEIKAMLQ